MLLVSRRRLLAGFALAAPYSAAAEPPVTMQGSTTFAARLMEPFGHLIEQRAGVTVAVIPNKSVNGVLAVLEQRADVAMISAPLEAEVHVLRGVRADLAYSRLQSFEVSRTRVAFVTHPSNGIGKLTLDELRRVLRGQIVNWHELGGLDLPLRPVMVREGGGVTLAVQLQLLAGQPFLAPLLVRVDTPRQVLKVVAQEPGALGITQPALAEQFVVARLETDGAVDQVLNLVTLDAPSARVQRVIAAARDVAFERLS
jgi:phosphate transport system substrate-binding protein